MEPELEAHWSSPLHVGRCLMRNGTSILFPQQPWTLKCRDVASRADKLRALLFRPQGWLHWSYPCGYTQTHRCTLRHTRSREHRLYVLWKRLFFIMAPEGVWYSQLTCAHVWPRALELWVCLRQAERQLSMEQPWERLSTYLLRP